MSHLFKHIHIHGLRVIEKVFGKVVLAIQSESGP